MINGITNFEMVALNNLKIWTCRVVTPRSSYIVITHLKSVVFYKFITNFKILRYICIYQKISSPIKHLTFLSFKFDNRSIHFSIIVNNRTLVL